MKSTNKELDQIKNINIEKVLIKICKEKGWNPKELTTGQLIWITTNMKSK